MRRLALDGASDRQRPTIACVQDPRVTAALDTTLGEFVALRSPWEEMRLATPPADSPIGDDVRLQLGALAWHPDVGDVGDRLLGQHAPIAGGSEGASSLLSDLVEPAKAMALEKLDDGGRGWRIAADWLRTKLDGSNDDAQFDPLETATI